MKFKVKFFGAKAAKGEQVKLVRTELEASERSAVERELKKQYKVINGLKIH